MAPEIVSCPRVTASQELEIAICVVVMPDRSAAMRWVMSSVAFAAWVARLFTSLATTAKPRPASPARAASMVALSASRLVWLAMLSITDRNSPICSDALCRSARLDELSCAVAAISAMQRDTSSIARNPCATASLVASAWRAALSLLLAICSTEVTSSVAAAEIAWPLSRALRVLREKVAMPMATSLMSDTVPARLRSEASSLSILFSCACWRSTPFS